MYQISRSIYRELEAEIIEDRLHATVRPTTSASCAPARRRCTA